MLRVLLIEDNPADVLIVREAIRASSVAADVIIARDGEEAFYFLDQLHFNPDLIFLDLNLPRFNGLEVLRRYPASRNVPVIVLTNSTNPSDRAHAMQLGAREYLTKPSDLGAFLHCVGDVLSRWTSRHSP